MQPCRPNPVNLKSNLWRTKQTLMSDTGGPATSSSRSPVSSPVPARHTHSCVTALGRHLYRTHSVLTWTWQLSPRAARGLGWRLGRLWSGGLAPTHCSLSSEVFLSIQTYLFFHVNLSIGVSSPIRKRQVGIVMGTEGNVHPRPWTPSLLAALRLAAPGRSPRPASWRPESEHSV